MKSLVCYVLGAWLRVCTLSGHSLSGHLYGRLSWKSFCFQNFGWVSLRRGILYKFTAGEKQISPLTCTPKNMWDSFSERIKKANTDLSGFGHGVSLSVSFAKSPLCAWLYADEVVIANLQWVILGPSETPSFSNISLPDGCHTVESFPQTSLWFYFHVLHLLLFSTKF